MGNILKEMRIKSWVKNIFVFLPIVFSLELFEVDRLVKAVILALSFCLVSSGIYILNDIIDVEKDRRHEVKKNRPIASGKISIPVAVCVFCLLMLIGGAMSCYIGIYPFLLILSYVIINVLYSKWLKKVALLDCFCIAAGFVIRVLVGGTIVSEGVSHWMFLTVVAVSLFMAFGKRRGELVSYTTKETREVLNQYDIGFLNGIIFLCAGVAMVFYSLWSISQKSNLVYTVPLVLFTVIRYLYLVFKGKADADPTNLILSDAILLGACGVCGIVMLVMLYGSFIV